MQKTATIVTMVTLALLFHAGVDLNDNIFSAGIPGKGVALAQPVEQQMACGTGYMSGDEIIHFRILNKTNDLITIQVDYRYHPAHGPQVYLGGYLLDAAGQILSFGFPPAAAPSMGQGTATMQVNFNRQLGRRESTELFIWIYEPYKSEAFVCRRFPYHAFWE